MGQLAPDSEAEPYDTTARVLLSGLGADELFGGYVRHATAYTRSGYAGLIDELKLDVSRLGKRNLGRDDRVMSHWSREVRFPFLDESLVKWAIELPAWEKCDFDNQGPDCDYDPEKRVLRLLADRLGMRSVAAEKKRAVGDDSVKHKNYRFLLTVLFFRSSLEREQLKWRVAKSRAPRCFSHEACGILHVHTYSYAGLK